MSLRTSAAPRQRSSLRKIYLFALIEFATYGALAAPSAVALSLKVLELVPTTQKEGALAIVTAIGGATALITNPLFGGMSDRTRSRFGRRRPWIAAGIVVGLLGAGIMLAAPSIAMLAIGWVIAQAGYNATFAALNAMLAEQVPDADRGKASGIFGAASGLGMLSAYALAAVFAKSMTVLFLAMPAVAVAIVIAVCVVVKDPVPEGEIPRVTIRSMLTSFVFNPKETPSFAYVALQRFIMQTGYTLVQAFGLYFLMLRMKMSTVEATQVTLLIGLITLVLLSAVSWGVGFLASRRGRYGGYLLGSIGLMAASLLISAFTDQFLLYLVGVLMSGVALGIYSSVDLALVMRTLPAGREGKFLGIFNMAKTLPQTIAPAAAPFLLMLGAGDPIAGGDKNYTALYLCATAAVLLSLLTIAGFRAKLNPSAAPVAETKEELIP
ncbi:MFS family permease [Microbacterium resistens]|uniref:MFS family permease n=1 Tax=Microbacterium resistens TaxID=156977 RepID=A0ABU1SEW8_9MICO|nr:MFS transporter [Microbacterium resistens]MDR6868135.1 MFS family permease [Microbacterium resistens]